MLRGNNVTELTRGSPEHSVVFLQLQAQHLVARSTGLSGVDAATGIDAEHVRVLNILLESSLIKAWRVTPKRKVYAVAWTPFEVCCASALSCIAKCEVWLRLSLAMCSTPECITGLLLPVVVLTA